MGCCFAKSKLKATNINDNFKIQIKEPINILYVEDVEIYYNLMKHIFEKYINLNVNLIWKKNVKDAYESIENDNIDVIFIDRILENEMGDDLINRLIDEKKFDISKIIIISSVDNLKDIESYIELGISYFMKPLDMKLFIKNMMQIFHI